MRFIQSSLLALSVLAALACSVLAGPVTVVHQGRLTSNGSPVTGTVDLRVTVFDDASAGSVVEGPITVTDVDVADGLFTAEIPLSDTSFDGSPRWFEIEAADAGTGSWFTLSPRQRVGVTPEAAHANRASSADSATIADYAVDGPFVFAEPAVSSGMNKKSTATTTRLAVGSSSDDCRLVGSIRIERPYSTQGPQGDPLPTGSIPSFLATVRRNVGSGYQVDWRQQSVSPPNPITLEIVTNDTNYGETTWRFESGVIVGYEQAAAMNQGAYEELTIMFPGTQQGSIGAKRIFQPLQNPAGSPKTPTLGKAIDQMGGPLGGLLQATWDGSEVELEIVDLVIEMKNSYDLASGNFSQTRAYSPCTLRRSVLGDSSLFDDFELGRGGAIVIEMLLGHAVFSTPMDADGLVVAVELFFADDGYLVEDYEFGLGNVIP